MKKVFALTLSLMMLLGLLAGCGSKTPAPEDSSAPVEQPSTATGEADPMADLIAAAKAEGELVVYGSCEEDYLSAACANFEKLYGIKTQYPARPR